MYLILRHFRIVKQGCFDLFCIFRLASLAALNQSIRTNQRYFKSNVSRLGEF